MAVVPRRFGFHGPVILLKIVGIDRVANLFCQVIWKKSLYYHPFFFFIKGQSRDSPLNGINVAFWKNTTLSLFFSFHSSAFGNHCFMDLLKGMLSALWSCFAQIGRGQNLFNFLKNAFFRKKWLILFLNKCHLVAVITLDFALFI